MLTYRNDAAARQRGLELLAEVREPCADRRFFLSELPVIDLYTAREMARRGDRDAAIPVMRNSVEAMFQERQLAYLIGATAVLVETLLGRTTEGAVAEAQSVIDRLGDLPAEEDPVLRAVTLLRLRALLSRARVTTLPTVTL